MNNPKDTPLKSMENTPVSISVQKPGVGISLKNKTLLMLIQLYSEDKDGLFWVLNNIRLRIQNDEASHLADAVIRKAKHEIPKA